MTNNEALAHQNLVGRVFPVFEHKGSKSKCKVIMVDKQSRTDKTFQFEVMVSTRPLEKIVTSNLVEELKYFLGIYTEIVNYLNK